MGEFHCTYNPQLPFANTLLPPEDASAHFEPAATVTGADVKGRGESENAAGVWGDRRSSWRGTAEVRTASEAAEPEDAVEQLERRIFLSDDFEISSDASLAGASSSRCHGTASLATTASASLCTLQRPGMSCSQVSGGKTNGHAFTPRTYYESDSTPRVFDELQGSGLGVGAAK